MAIAVRKRKKEEIADLLSLLRIEKEAKGEDIIVHVGEAEVIAKRGNEIVSIIITVVADKESKNKGRKIKQVVGRDMIERSEEGIHPHLIV